MRLTPVCRVGYFTWNAGNYTGGCIIRLSLFLSLSLVVFVFPFLSVSVCPRSRRCRICYDRAIREIEKNEGEGAKKRRREREKEREREREREGNKARKGWSLPDGLHFT